MDKKYLVPLILVCLTVCFVAHEFNKPKHPFIHWLGGMAKNAVWVAPLFFNESPQDQSVQGQDYAYGAMPQRMVGDDGHEVLDHGENW